MEQDREMGLLNGRKEAWMVRPLHRSEYHLFEDHGNSILFDIASGAFFQVDRVICDLLAHCQGRSLIDLLETLRDRYTEKEIQSAFKELYNAGILQEEPPEQVPFTPPGRLEVVRIGLDVTYDGLSANHVFTRDPDACPPNAYMSEEVARKAVDLLMKESGRIRQCQVTFQGEEPLLNAPLVEKIIDYGLEQARTRGKEILFEVRSSDRLLNERLFAHLRKKNAHVVVKMEGRSNDGLALFSGAGPYSLSSVDVREYTRENGASVHLDGSLDLEAADPAARVHEQIQAYPGLHSLTLRIGAVPSDGGTIAEEALPQALAGLERLAEYVKHHVLSGNPTWIGDFEDCISQLLNRKISYYHCGAGTRYLTVDPEGKIYVCPGLVANDAFCVGDVHNGVDRTRQRGWIKSTHVEKFEACTSCWARYLCGGGCRLGSFLASGKIDRPAPAACALIRRTYELAMATCLDIATENGECLQRRYLEEN